MTPESIRIAFGADRTRVAYRHPARSLGTLPIVGFLFTLFVVSVLASCSQTVVSSPICRVIYDPNNATAGLPPVDPTAYCEGDTAIVMGNVGFLARGDFPFYVGWNASADGTGDTYRAGDAMTVGPQDVVLYARWSDPEKLTSPYVTADDQFGGVLDTDGQLIVVGSPGAEAADLYRLDRYDGWVHEARLLSPAPEPGGRFGNSVAIDGDCAVVGAPGVDGLDWNRGAV